MKPVLMFMMKTCPYCRETFGWMDELKKENARYADINVTMIDENAQPDVAEKYDYYLVPTFYVDGVKVHEGVCSREIVQDVFEKAMG